MSTIVAGVIASAVVGCGGGGGGDAALGGAADVRLDVSPQDIDVGDRTTLEIDVRDVHDDGIVLKIRYPNELSYVSGSSRLLVDDESHSFTPDAISPVDDQTYILYRMPQGILGENNHATIVLELRGNARKSEATISVDPDVDSTTPFDPENPEFETAVEQSVEIK